MGSGRAPRHGHARRGELTATYTTWKAMIKRCTNERADQWPYYGGRGIKVCERWRERFENFLEDMGDRPERRSLDRIDPDGNYEPGNCRWATIQEQRVNRRPLDVCRRGHPREGDNLYVSPKGLAYCKECNRLAKRAYRERKAQA